MSFQSAYLNVDLLVDREKKNIEFTLDLDLTGFIKNLVYEIFCAPNLKKQVEPGKYEEAFSSKFMM